MRRPSKTLRASTIRGSSWKSSAGGASSSFSFSLAAGGADSGLSLTGVGSISTAVSGAFAMRLSMVERGSLVFFCGVGAGSGSGLAAGFGVEAAAGSGAVSGDGVGVWRAALISSGSALPMAVMTSLRRISWRF